MSQNLLRTSGVLKPALALASAVSACLFASSGAAAQDSTSRPVVQALPSAEVQRLNRALMQLARSPESLSSLLEAGDASLDVGDFEAAIGFYGRAGDVAPADARVKLGLARAYLRSGRPFESLPFFAGAQSAGMAARDLLTDQALAFDMVGDQSSAQTAYRRAIEIAPDNAEARRRLAISYAISGNEAQFMGILGPLIEKGDTAAFRARAFGLAILGQQDRAEAIVNASMPPDLAARINPYLSYMPRLTASQQAAAANLGIFPRAAEIGREDPRLARLARQNEAGSRLEPAGEPLGPRAAAASDNNAQPARTTGLPAVTTSVAAPDRSRPVAAATASAVMLSQNSGTQRAPERRQERTDVANAFADLDSGDMPVPAAARDAVDIAAIDIPREVAPKAEPAPPAHPRRIWVQLATGRDTGALKFDWRRIVRKAPDLLGGFKPHTTPWGQANRLLAGPVADRDAARTMVNALADKGIETFAYTSPEGTEIQLLD